MYPLLGSESAVGALPHLPGRNGSGGRSHADASTRVPAGDGIAWRAAFDADLAREVQAGLFPRRLPRLETLAYAGLSLPAGLVSGDYFDFLDLGRGYLGLAVGDVSGKGVAAALLMANLQAHVRSQCALAVEDIGSLLRPVNRLFHECTLPGRYATLFFAEYRDADRQLRYVNCGHPPALLCHRDGAIERLVATATVLGLDEDWDCSVGEKQLLPGDMLVLYTDGVTEATNGRDEEFGERRLAELLSAGLGMTASDLLKFVLEAAGRFAGGSFQDDVTLVAARCEPA
jgi:serine phosphatase RsbU (regulator of sigma subunit)